MLQTALRDEVAIVTLEHGKANALDLELCRELAHQVTHATSAAKAAVITGRGSIFSAGVDLLRVLDEGPDYVTEFLSALSTLCETVVGFPKPLVAAINGHAIAGGCVLACMADRRIMAQGTGRVGVPELLVGVPFPAAPLAVLQSAIPTQFVTEVIYGCDTYDPPAALARGLIDEITEPDSLLDHAVATASKLSGVSPEAFRLTKAHLRRSVLHQIRSPANDIEADVRRFWASPQAKILIRDYVNKTFKKVST